MTSSCHLEKSTPNEVPRRGKFHPCHLGAKFDVHCINRDLSQCNNMYKNTYLISEISLSGRELFSSNFVKNTYFFALGRGPYMGPQCVGTEILANFDTDFWGCFGGKNP